MYFITSKQNNKPPDQLVDRLYHWLQPWSWYKLLSFVFSFFRHCFKVTLTTAMIFSVPRQKYML